MKLVGIFLLTLMGCAALSAQTPNPSASTLENVSGMYTFLREGEFVQITVEDAGRVTGFVSRYGDSESDRGVFLNQFFKSGKLAGNNLSFATQTVHLVWFELQAVVEHGQGKRPGEEGYRVLRGKLTEYHEGTDKKNSSKVYEVAFKSFPQDVETTSPKQ
jgi:hypothetical protein